MGSSEAPLRLFVRCGNPARSEKRDCLLNCIVVIYIFYTCFYPQLSLSGLERLVQTACSYNRHRTVDSWVGNLFFFCFLFFCCVRGTCACEGVLVINVVPSLCFLIRSKHRQLACALVLWMQAGKKRRFVTDPYLRFVWGGGWGWGRGRLACISPEIFCP